MANAAVWSASYVSTMATCAALPKRKRDCHVRIPLACADAVAFVALLIFGPKRLPEMGSAVGKTFTAFKKSLSEIADVPKVGALAEPVAHTETTDVLSTDVTIR